MIDCIKNLLASLALLIKHIIQRKGNGIYLLLRVWMLFIKVKHDSAILKQESANVRIDSCINHYSILFYNHQKGSLVHQQRL